MKRITLGRISTIVATLVAAAGLAASASADPSSSCPNINQLNVKVASNVGATFSNVGNTTTYTFISATNENPVNGVPGLVKYCVYPDPAAQPTAIVVEATGADGELWKSGSDSSDFMFGRPAGNKSNIPLDGNTTTMGTVTWSSAPTTKQIIVLHIADSAMCNALFGTTAPTCFVFPGAETSCVAGDSAVTYNANPFGVVNCPKSAIGFEATATNEFGDQVGLAGTARQLDGLNVVFASFGCGDAGHWNTGDCVTTPGEDFTIPITANIYNSADCIGTPLVCAGAPLATVTTSQTIPYRPSASSQCTGADAGMWFNPLGNGGTGACQNAISIVLPFTFPAGTTLPDNVIWTVAFNTSHSGYDPIVITSGPASCNSTAQGCGYDSLNVGDQTYVNAPYAGTDTSLDVAFISWWDGGYPPSGTLKTLQAQSGWALYRPLGEIIAH